MHFADRLTNAIKEKNSAICVGLDPRLDRIPAFILNKAVVEQGQTFTAVAHAFLEFCTGIIDAVHDIVPAVKVQSAFFEEYGFQGVWAYEEILKYAKKKGLITIADVKRNDIGSTAEAYARAYVGKTEFFGEKLPVFDADALTVSAYLGYDGIKPFLDECREHEKGIFILVRTSNLSSGDLQDRITVDEQISISELMGNFVEAWGSEDLGESGYSFVGSVVGAPYPKEAAKLRKLMGTSYFLVPGFGAQGGTAEDVKVSFNEDGLGALISSSREIIFAFEKSGATKAGEDYAEAARDAAIKMNAEINAVR